MGVWLGPMGKSKAKSLPKFTFSGSYELRHTTRQDGTVDWELVLKSSGTLTFQRVVPMVDIFLVGGGASGAKAYEYNNGARGGSGGKGGQCVTHTAVSVSCGSYSIVIGGSGQNTTALGKTATGGGGASAGTGAYARTTNWGGGSYAGTDAGNGTPAFGSGTTLYQNGWKYGPGGGGGDAYARRNYSEYTSVQSGGAPGNSGRSDVGADGGNTSHALGYNGAANTGAGGGGGFGSKDQAEGDDWSNGGSGGSGIVIIRNHR